MCSIVTVDPKFVFFKTKNGPTKPTKVYVAAVVSAVFYAGIVVGAEYLLS